MDSPSEPTLSEPTAQNEVQAPAGWYTALQRFDPSSAGDLARAILLILLVVLLGALACRYVSYASALLYYPYEWDEDEGLPIYFAQRLLRHQPIYGDFNDLPMVSSMYPPLFHAAVALLVPKFGATLFAGRLVSVACMIGIGMILIVIVRQETGRWALGVLAAALGTVSPYMTIFGPLSRHDALMILLVLAGLLLVRQYPRSWLALPLGLLVLMLACYTKQQAALLVPAAFWHLWRQGRRVAIISLAAFAMAGVASLICVQYWSGGYFWQSTIVAQATDFIWGFLAERTQRFLELHAILAAAALTFFVYQVSRRGVDVWGALLLASVSIILLTGKSGAAINYYMPSIVAAVICTCVGLDRLTRCMPPTWTAGASCAVMLVLSLQTTIWWLYPIQRPTEADREAGDRIVALIRDTKGDPLTERRVMFSLMAGRQPQIDACAMFMAYMIGRERPSADSAGGPPGWKHKPGGTICWDPAELIKAIDEKHFPMLVLVPEFFPPEVLSAIMLNYQILKDDRNRAEQITMGNWHRAIDRENKYFLMVPR